MPDKTAAGFSLPEILITIAILVVGLMAALRVQQASVQAMREATIQGAAMQLATELADAIRAGTQANIHLPLMLEVLNDSSEPALISCFVDECTTEQMLRFDWSEWQQRIARLASGVQVTVSHDVQASAQPLLIKISWPAAAYGIRSEMIVPVGPMQP